MIHNKNLRTYFKYWFVGGINMFSLVKSNNNEKVKLAFIYIGAFLYNLRLNFNNSTKTLTKPCMMLDIPNHTTFYLFQFFQFKIEM